MYLSSARFSARNFIRCLVPTSLGVTVQSSTISQLLSRICNPQSSRPRAFARGSGLKGFRLPCSTMNRAAGVPETVVIERQEQIDEFCVRARAEGRFAFDTEFVMEDRYEPEVCLVQLASEEAAALIDPFLKLDLQPVWELVCDRQVETVVHAGQEDLAMAVRRTGQVARGVFDVQIAAGLVGYDYPLSLQKLVQSTLQVRLRKSKTLTDWRQRPLNAAQLRYAADDVSYLLAVRRKLHDRLVGAGRLEWAEEEFRGFEDMSLYARVEEDKLRRVKGINVLKGRQLAVAGRLLLWRDGLAQVLNRPARVALKDHLLVEIARHELSSFSELRELRGLNMSDRNVQALGGIVKEALATPPEKWPAEKPFDAEAPREAVLVALATAVVRGYCLDYDLAYSLIATKKSLRDLIRHRTVGQPSDASAVELLCGWRGRTVGVMLDEVLAGRRTIHVEPSNGDWVVRVGPRQPPGPRDPAQ